jgi:hypothetical protein
MREIFMKNITKIAMHLTFSPYLIRNVKYNYNELYPFIQDMHIIMYDF